MKLISMQRGSLVLLLAATLVLSACESSFLSKDAIDYKGAKQRQTLEIPPKMGTWEDSGRWSVPGTSVDMMAYEQNRDPNSGYENLSNVFGDITMKRDGNKRWLLVSRSPQEIWGSLETFWQNIGFMLVEDEPALGVMETDWAENRADLPQDIVRRTLGGILGSLYSTGQKDKFRTRIEVTDQGTEIFVTHQGVKEVFADRDQVTTVWQPRPSDPDLEAEILRRLMIHLGASQEHATRELAKEMQGSSDLEVVEVDNAPVLLIKKDFETTWRWAGIALDRIGFVVIDRNKGQGVYQVRYVDYVGDSVATSKGLLSGLFGDKERPESGVYDYVVKVQASQNNETYLKVLDKNSMTAVDNKVATRILGALSGSLE